MNNKNKILVVNSLGVEAGNYMNSIFDLLSDRFDMIITPTGGRQADLPNAGHNTSGAIYLGPIINNDSHSKSIKYFVFLILFPFLFIYNFIVLYLTNKKQGIKKIVLTNLNEKIILTPAANILGLKVFWFELKYFDKNISSWPKKIINVQYRMSSKRVEIITASNFIREQLANRQIGKNDIAVLSPSIKVNNHEHQENIFESMAKKDYLIKQRKFFTIGTICRLDESQRLESLFNAINLCLETVPNLQLIVVGEGSEKKNLSWLAKKIAVENIVWFVGGLDRPKKWLKSFDLFVLPVSKVLLSDHYNILEAMSVGMPVIGPKNFGLEDLVAENKNGSLIEFDNPEMLARLILKLEQNIGWRRELGRNAKAKVDKCFTIDKMAENIKEIFN